MTNLIKKSQAALRRSIKLELSRNEQNLGVYHRWGFSGPEMDELSSGANEMHQMLGQPFIDPVAAFQVAERIAVAERAIQKEIAEAIPRLSNLRPGTPTTH